MDKIFYKNEVYYTITDVSNLLEYKNIRNLLNHVKGKEIRLTYEECLAGGVPSRGNHGNTLLSEECLGFILVNAKSLHINRLKAYITKEVLYLKSREEFIALKVVEQITGVTLLYQYPVLEYFIDGYDLDNNVAYEVDEDHHRYSQYEDEVREQAIRNHLGCDFVRIKV
ncbi:hypothetical protein VPHF99_0045 [Vibrio phage F99]|nr:hypothetical protein MYOV056v2_p0037 [Vibrio phage 184E37.3a]QZI87114.1 hypothetical protein MYOV085v1_p0092 [Vibrio phage 355E48.1]QZI90018.1 hypothetical protein MYOV057v1_p0103 [Vibrio phage 184E37.1]